MQAYSLDALRDVHLPLPVSLWPPAPGWWIVTLLIFIICLIFFWFMKKKGNQRKLNNEMKYLIECYESRFIGSQDEKEAYRNFSKLIRRFILSISTEKRVAGIYGEKWLDFLHYVAGGKTEKTESLNKLLNCPYHRDPVGNPLDLVDSMNQWLKLIPRDKDNINHKIKKWFDA